MILSDLILLFGTISSQTGITKMSFWTAITIRPSLIQKINHQNTILHRDVICTSRRLVLPKILSTMCGSESGLSPPTTAHTGSMDSKKATNLHNIRAIKLNAPNLTCPKINGERKLNLTDLLQLSSHTACQLIKTFKI